MKRNRGCLLSLFSFFLSLCWIRVIPQANPLLEAKLSGVNHLVNSSPYFLTGRICHQCRFEALLSLMSRPGLTCHAAHRETDNNELQLLVISYYVNTIQNMFPIFNKDN